MSSTSDQTTQQSKTRLIVGEIGVDTETGIIGKGHSYDNGKTFVVDDTIYGRIYHKDDHGRIWNGIQDKVEKVVKPAINSANSAVAYANDAVKNSRVNSQAIDDINSAVSDATLAAAVARSDGLRAWNAAQSNVNLIDLNYASASAAISSARTEALAAANEAKTSASAAQADIVAVRSDVATVQADVTATRSDVAVAKSNIADTKTTLAQTASDLNSKITGVEASLADTTSALSDAKTAFNSDVAEAKNLANAAQTTADSAVKSASSVANDLTAVASQAKANADGITKVTSDVGLLQTTVADNSGNISTIQATAKQIQQAVSDNAGNITVAKQTADSAVAVASDAKSNATVAIQTASQASITASNASGQAASAVITANGAMTTASDAKSNATVAVQTASGANLTAINAKNDATVAKQTASEAKVQASNAESDFAQLSIRAGKIEASVANNSGAIASVQQTANGLTTTVGEVNDRIKKIVDNTNWTTKTGPLDMDTLTTTQNIYYRDANLKNADGETGWAYIQVVSMGERVTQTVWHDRSSIQHTRTGALNLKNSNYNWDAWNKVATYAQVVEVKKTVDGIATTINDPKTGLNATYQTAAGNATTISNINGDVSQLKVSASSASVALSDAAGNISSLQATASELETKYADAAGDINTLKTNASGFSQTLTNAQGDISTLKSTVSGVQNTLTDAQGNISTLQSDVSGLKKTTSDHTGSIATLQATANALTSQMSSAQGDISTLKQTASDFSSKVSGMETSLASANGKINSITSNGGGRNLLLDSNGRFQPNSSKTDNWAMYSTSTVYMTQGQQYTVHANASSGLIWSGTHNPNVTSNNVVLWLTDGIKVSQIISDPNTGTGTTFTWNNPSGTYYLRVNTYKSDNSGYAEKVMFEKGTVAHDWSPAPEDTDAKITANTTAIEQNKNAITLKADQTNVDTLKGTVNQLQSSLTVQAGQIQTKVSASDVSGMLTGYATQEYTQSLVTQKADDWNVNLTKLKNDTQTSLTNLAVGVEGVQAQVYNSDGSSKITQLSSLIATKVSQGDYNSQITQLKNDINLRVSKGDLISQINLEAGTALIQSNKIVLDAGTTVFTGDAFIPAAAIAELDADKLTFYGNGSKATIGASIAQYDDDKQKSTINLQYNGGIEIHSSNQQGSILTMHDNTIRLASKSWGDNSNPYQYSGFYAAPNYSLMNTYHRDGTTSGVAIDDNQIHIYGSSKDQQLGALQADVGWYSINGKTGLLTGNQISLKAGNTQAVLTDNNININNASDTNDKNYDVGIHIKGWAEMTGWFTCMGLTQTSLLSAKTRIEPLDTAKALELINSADVATYQYKQEVAHGGTKRHASVIIDDVNDVAQYQTPDEIISEDRQGRNDGDIVGYLMGAVQELTKKLKTLESKVG